MSDNNSLGKFVKKFSGYDAINKWGISTSALVVFLMVLLVSTIMLIVNGIYFIKVFNGSTDEDINNYWSRGGSLTLAIFNIFFAILLFVEFLIILTIILRRNSYDDPACLKGLTEIDTISGLPTSKKVNEKLAEANIAYASANPEKTGYVRGLAGKGAIDTNGLYIGSDYLTTEEGYETLRQNVKDERDKYILYDTISNMTNLNQVGAVRDRNEISLEIMNPLNEKVRTVRSGSDIDTYKTSLLDTNPPFDPTKHYERDTRYNIRKF
jgi:hypothetical protein